MGGRHPQLVIMITNGKGVPPPLLNLPDVRLALPSKKFRKHWVCKMKKRLLHTVLCKVRALFRKWSHFKMDFGGLVHKKSLSNRQAKKKRISKPTDVKKYFRSEIRQNILRVTGVKEDFKTISPKKSFPKYAFKILELVDLRFLYWK